MVEIRAERAGDEEAIRAVVAAAFGQDDEADLVDRLRADGDLLASLVATVGGTAGDADEGAIVGHVALSPVALDDAPGGRFAGVAPLAVAEAHRRRGIGAALMRAAIDEGLERGLDALFLLGSPAYYPRFGFVRSSVGNEYGATDAFMHLVLVPGALDGLRGPARYGRAFRELG